MFHFQGTQSNVEWKLKRKTIIQMYLQQSDYVYTHVHYAFCSILNLRCFCRYKVCANVLVFVRFLVTVIITFVESGKIAKFKLHLISKQF